MKHTLLITVVLMLTGAVAQAAEGQNDVARCTKRIESVFSGEVLPAVIEACFDKDMRKEVNACKKSDKACISDAAGFDE